MLPLTKVKNIVERGTALRFLYPNSSCNRTGWVVYLYSGMIIVKVDFDRDYYKSVVDKMNDYYKGYYVNELLNRANSE